MTATFKTFRPSSLWPFLDFSFEVEMNYKAFLLVIGHSSCALLSGGGGREGGAISVPSFQHSITNGPGPGALATCRWLWKRLLL